MLQGSPASLYMGTWCSLGNIGALIIIGIGFWGHYTIIIIRIRTPR